MPILISSGLAFGFTIFSDVIGALTFATATRLVGYILCCIALFRLSRRANAPPPQFRLRAPGFISLATAVLFTDRTAAELLATPGEADAIARFAALNQRLARRCASGVNLAALR